MLDIRRLIRALRYSFNGLRDAFIGETAFRQEVILALVLMPIALWLGENNIERALMIGTLLVVLIVELVNTAIEAIVDRIGVGIDDLSRRAKDMGSAAVFVSLLLALIVWALALLG